MERQQNQITVYRSHLIIPFSPSFSLLALQHHPVFCFFIISNFPFIVSSAIVCAASVRTVSDPLKNQHTFGTRRNSVLAIRSVCKLRSFTGIGCVKPSKAICSVALKSYSNSKTVTQKIHSTQTFKESKIRARRRIDFT